MLAQNKSLADAIKELAKGDLDKRSTTQLTKAKQPPIWIGTNFECFRREVEAWELGNKEPAQDKFHALMESLKKNNDIKDYVVTHILEKTTKQATQTVTHVLDFLVEKFVKTFTEKAKEVFGQLIDFVMTEGKMYEQYKDRFQSLLTDCEREWFIKV
jgi:hypothetical protein